MNKYLNSFVILFLLLPASPSFTLSQTTVIRLTEVIDEAELIMVGKLVDKKYLFPERFNVRTDGTISTVTIERILRGRLRDSTALIIMIDSLHSAYPFHFFVPQKYLLFLNRFELPLAFIEKYSLQGKTFYYPAFDEFGIISLEEKDGPDYLRRTEDHLRGLPPVPSPTVPVSVLLDSLIIKKHQAFESNLIGDENFVKNLDNHLQNAQKHLAKHDSVNCAKEVEMFQDKVKKEYEKTIDDQEKNKPRDKRFVTKEGYLILYYNAKYILDRLAKRK